MSARAMTHADLHMAVREAIAGRGYPFMVSTSSVEQHPGRVDVEWSVSVIIDGKVEVYAKGHDASEVLSRVRSNGKLTLSTASAVPVGLAAIGAPPEENNEEESAE